MNRTRTPMPRFIWGVLIGLLLAPATARAQSEEVVYYHTDAIGSVRMITDSTGTVLARYDYTPFGQPWNPPGLIEGMQFTGKEREWQTGLDYFNARDFMSFTGRFTTIDPGHVNGDVFDPQSWNGYAYARNNPLVFTDPSGTEYQICAFGGGDFGPSCGWVENPKFFELLTDRQQDSFGWLLTWKSTSILIVIAAKRHVKTSVLEFSLIEGFPETFSEEIGATSSFSTPIG